MYLFVNLVTHMRVVHTQYTVKHCHTEMHIFYLSSPASSVAMTAPEGGPQHRQDSRHICKLRAG